jgi:D-alanine-D-alanine ligase
MHIALVYNQRPEDLKRDDPKLEATIEGDEKKTIQAIGEAIKHHGHTLVYYRVTPTIYERLKHSRAKIDLIFNLAEGITTRGDREAQLPMIAQILGIPHTGPGPLSAALILNKERAKEIWRAHGLATPASQLFTHQNQALKTSLTFPLIVKPVGEGSGMGIKSSSIVSSQHDLHHAVHTIHTKYHQPALVETYLSGREFTVAILGNGHTAKTLPIVEINFDAFPEGAPPIDSYEAKFIYGATGQVPMSATEFCPAKLPKKLASQINALAIASYLTIGCLDFGRVDIRLDTKGVPHVLEINHPPGLMSDPDESSFFTIAGRAAGLSFPAIIGTILASASSRLKLSI